MLSSFSANLANGGRAGSAEKLDNKTWPILNQLDIYFSIMIICSLCILWQHIISTRLPVKILIKDTPRMFSVVEGMVVWKILLSG